MKPTTRNEDALLSDPFFVTLIEEDIRNYYDEISFMTNSKSIPTSNGTANNGYAWINVDPKQTVVAEVVAPESAACSMIKKVCT